MIALAAGSIAGFLTGRPLWLLVQRWLMGTVLAGLAVKMALGAAVNRDCGPTPAGHRVWPKASPAVNFTTRGSHFAAV